MPSKLPLSRRSAVSTAFTPADRCARRQFAWLGLRATEARVLYELAQRDDDWQAAEMAKALDLDPAYLSRDPATLYRAWLVGAQPLRCRWPRLAPALTDEGEERRSARSTRLRGQALAILSRLAPAQQGRLVDALADAGGCSRAAARRARRLSASTALAISAGSSALMVGSMRSEYGWDLTFEALVAEIAAKFLREFKPDRERCFIAELDGTPAGSAFVVQEDEATAAAQARAGGEAGPRLRARQAAGGEAVGLRGRSAMRAWCCGRTTSSHAARAIYVAEGFRLVAEERHPFLRAGSGGGGTGSWCSRLSAEPASLPPPGRPASRRRPSLRRRQPSPRRR